MLYTDGLLLNKAGKRNCMCRRHQERSVLIIRGSQRKEHRPDLPLKWIGIVLFIAVMSTELAVADQAAIRHLNEGLADGILHCIDANIGIRTLVYEEFLGDFSKIQCAPGQSRVQTTKNSEARGFRILSNERWAFLVPADLFTGSDRPFRVSWTALNVDVDLVEGPNQSEQRLSERQLATLKEELTSKTRFVPVYAEVDGSPAELATVHLRYRLSVYKNLGGNVSVVAVLHEGDEFAPLGSFGRVVFGELVGEKVQLRWDSPLLFVADFALQDIDNNGDKKIIVRATVGFGAHGPGWDLITILDREGREITRQQDCEWMNRTEFQSGSDRACPIAGREVNLKVTENGAVINATTTPNDGDAVYVLKDGRFVLSRAHVKTLYRRPSH